MAADLTSDTGWDEALGGVDYVQHLASPFPLRQPRGREDLVPAAVGGVERVLSRALEGGVKRVVQTSSIAAVMYRADRPREMAVGEEDWTDPEWPALTAYIVSKTRAEQAFWAMAEAADARDRVCAINPGFVLGPAYDRVIGASLEAVQMFLKGAYPAVPPVHFPVVDVRDLAALHVAAMTAEGAPGRRLLAAGETISMQDKSRILKAAYPDRKIPTGELPAWFIRLLANVDKTMKTILPDLGCRPVARSAYVTELTGIAFRPAREAVEAAGESLVRLGLAD